MESTDILVGTKKTEVSSVHFISESGKGSLSVTQTGHVRTEQMEGNPSIILN